MDAVRALKRIAKSGRVEGGLVVRIRRDTAMVLKSAGLIAFVPHDHHPDNRPMEYRWLLTDRGESVVKGA